MKKKKTAEQSAANFKHSPFKSLKGFTPAPSVAETKKELPDRKEELHGDDSELFLRAVAGIRKIKREVATANGPSTQKNPEPSQSTTALEDRQLFLQAMRKIGTTMQTFHERDGEDLQASRQSASSRMKQLKRGTMQISQELDLHGFLRDEALGRLEQFITSAYVRGLKAVLVITGKGINSPEGPVLRGAVAAWLRERGKGMIVEFGPAPRDKGGSGAFVVFLNRRKG